MLRLLLYLTGGQDDSYAQIEIDDLRDEEASNGIFLDMQDRERYFEGRMANGSQEPSEPVCHQLIIWVKPYADVCKQNVDPAIVIADTMTSLQGWESRMTQV